MDVALLEIPEISQALEFTEIAAYSAAELLAYERSWDSVSTEKTLLLDTFKEGRAEGTAEGIEEGGAKRDYEIARSLLVKGLDINFVAEITGLSIDQLRLIKLL